MGTKFILTKDIWAQNILNKNLLHQIFRPKILFGPKISWGQNLFDTKFLGQNIFGPKEFFDQTKIFCGSINTVNKKTHCGSPTYQKLFAGF